LRKTEDEIEKEESIDNNLPAQPEEIESQLTPSKGQCHLLTLFMPFIIINELFILQ
jgi:hypothetical protein